MDDGLLKQIFLFHSKVIHTRPRMGLSEISTKLASI